MITIKIGNKPTKQQKEFNSFIREFFTLMGEVLRNLIIICKKTKETK